MTVAVRPLADDDRRAWEPLWRGYLDFYGVELAPEVTERLWPRLMDPLIGVHGHGAWRDGRLVGIVHCVLHPATWAVGPYCYLEDLYVEERARGTGAGRALIEAVYALADERGAARVYWMTAADNAAARRLYDRVARLTEFVQYRR